MTMKSRTYRIDCENAKAASVAFVRMPSCRFFQIREGGRFLSAALWERGVI